MSSCDTRYVHTIPDNTNLLYSYAADMVHKARYIDYINGGSSSDTSYIIPGHIKPEITKRTALVQYKHSI
jgi:hypothetical protein